MAETRVDTFSKKEMLTFLNAVDSELNEKTRVILIGGAAAILAFGNSRSSIDIDTFNNIDALKKSIEKAKKKTGLNISFARSAVAFGPKSFESRLQQYTETKFKNLNVFVPEVHDFVMMKLTRLIQRDLDDIIEIHGKTPLKADTLFHLFKNEMGDYVGNRDLLNEKYLAVSHRKHSLDEL